MKIGAVVICNSSPGQAVAYARQIKEAGLAEFVFAHAWQTPVEPLMISEDTLPRHNWIAVQDREALAHIDHVLSRKIAGNQSEPASSLVIVEEPMPVKIADWLAADVTLASLAKLRDIEAFRHAVLAAYSLNRAMGLRSRHTMERGLARGRLAIVFGPHFPSLQELIEKASETKKENETLLLSGQRLSWPFMMHESLAMLVDSPVAEEMSASIYQFPAFWPTIYRAWRRRATETSMLSDFLIESVRQSDCVRLSLQDQKLTIGSNRMLELALGGSNEDLGPSNHILARLAVDAVLLSGVRLQDAIEGTDNLTVNDVIGRIGKAGSILQKDLSGRSDWKELYRVSATRYGLEENNNENLLYLARALRSLGFKRTASDALAETAAVQPTDGTRFEIAQEFMRLGNLNRALESYKMVIDANPSHVGALTNAGICQFKRGQIDEAAHFLERAVEIKGDHQQARRYLEMAREAA